MDRRLFFVSVATLAVVSASPVLAQSRISVGQTQQGALTASDPALGDGSHFDCWLFDAPGGSVTVNLQSSGFDTVVMVGAGANCGDNSDAATVNDDGPGMGTNSQAVLSNARGPHWIVVNSYGAGETGNYTLSLVGAGGGGNAARPSGRSAVALPTVESEWDTEPATCHAAYAAMDAIRANRIDLTVYGNLGAIDYASRARSTGQRVPASEAHTVNDYRDNFAAMASWGSLGQTPTGASNGHRPLAEYLTALGNCDRALGFTPVTRFN